jgi:hypothetical protein
MMEIIDFVSGVDNLVNTDYLVEEVVKMTCFEFV